MLWHTEWQHAYILGLVYWSNYLLYIIEMDRGILPLPLAEGGKDTTGWRRAHLSALISHTGQLSPPSLPSDLLNAPCSSICWHLQLKHTASILDSHLNFENFTQFQFQVGLWLDCCIAAMQHWWKIKDIIVVLSHKQQYCSKRFNFTRQSHAKLCKSYYWRHLQCLSVSAQNAQALSSFRCSKF